MACIDLNSDEQRVLTLDFACVVLQLGDILEGVEWHDSVVVVCGECHHGRVHLLLGVVERAVLDQVVETSIFFTASEIRTPKVANRKLVESEHIVHWNLADNSSIQIWSLICASTDKKTTV